MKKSATKQTLAFKIDCEDTQHKFNFDYEMEVKSLLSTINYKNDVGVFFKDNLTDMSENLYAREMNGVYECKVDMKLEFHKNSSKDVGNYKDISRVIFYEDVRVIEFKSREVIEEFLEIAVEMQNQYLDSQIFSF